MNKLIELIYTIIYVTASIACYKREDICGLLLLIIGVLLFINLNITNKKNN